MLLKALKLSEITREGSVGRKGLQKQKHGQNKQFWNKTDITLPHKTEVLVKEQDLKHEGWGRYSGYLKYI